MVKLTKIYTRGGDQGKTSLGDGQRVSKTDPRINAIGAIDELNAHVGLCLIDAPSEIRSLLSHIQNDLFDLGADLCVPDLTHAALRITASQVNFLEKKIDAYNADLSPLTSFILPGGSLLSAQLHVARAVARRAERDIIHLNDHSPLNTEVIKYINRLSDLLFVLCRYVNDRGEKDVLWVPGAHRQENQKEPS